MQILTGSTKDTDNVQPDDDLSKIFIGIISILYCSAKSGDPCNFIAFFSAFLSTSVRFE